jgi:glycosyltransferase involved in cell wall biosynthesis
MTTARAPSIVMVSASFHPTVGGAEKQAWELSRALLRRGERVVVLTRRLPGLSREDSIDGVPVIRLWCLGKGRINSLSFMMSLFFCLMRRAWSYDVIHVHLAGSPALVCALVARLRGKGCLVKVGGGRGVGELSGSRGSLPGRMKLWGLRVLAPPLVTVAREVAEEITAHLGALSVQVVPNGVDTERYRPATERERADARSRFGLPASGLGFVYAGRFSPEKRLLWFLGLWAEAARHGAPAAFLAFFGEGFEAPLLRQEAVRLGVSDRAFIVPPVADVSRAYAAGDVFMLPSVSEGLSNALLEAMASGLAVIASRVGGTAEAVAEAESGFLFDPYDEEGAKRQIHKFLARPALAREMGRAARERAIEGYSLTRIAERYDALYRSLAGLPTY